MNTQKNKIVDGKIKSENIVFKKQFDPREFTYFSSLKHEAPLHYLFSTKKDNETRILEVYEMTKDPKVEILSIKNFELTEPWRMAHLDILSQILTKCPHDKIGLLFRGESSEIERLLCGENNLGKKNTDKVLECLALLDKFSSIVIHSDGLMIDLAFPPLSREDEIKYQDEKRIEKLIADMKILGEDGYKIGSNPQIENRFAIPKDKAQDIGEIQKKYFGEILKMNIKTTEIIKDPSEKKENALNKIKELRGKLEAHGVKLKMK